MLSFSAQVVKRLTKYYNLSQAEAEAIISDEWDYVEEFFHQGATPMDVAKELVSIYMVA
ncbi:MAG: hypothetical protein QG559_396 [Campylobacterota bacterium]|jgi:Glu-tRNA(Gln) amidotransferase subunit E-like FAD-binding protein|nr:hypothetical protein [Campylobacterota bacterium]